MDIETGLAVIVVYRLAIHPFLVAFINWLADF